MRTVDKALTLLNLFTTGSPEAGLSDVARTSGLDKATTLRMLTVLTRHGLLELHPETKKYRLGPTVLKLARVREASLPVASVIQPVLARLASQTGETAHASLAGESSLMTIAIAEPQRSTRVYVDPSQPLPFHATASGIVYLSYGPGHTVEALLDAADFEAHTDYTVTTAADLRKEIGKTRRRGFAIARRAFEDEVIGIAAPIFDWSGNAYGALAVASVAARLTPDKERAIAGAVVQAAVQVTESLGAEPAPEFLEANKERAA